MNDKKLIAQELAKMGRGGDTMLAHITPHEAKVLKAMGGAGTINPYTGLPEYRFRWRSIVRAVAPIVSVAIAVFAPELIPSIGSSILGTTGTAAGIAEVAAGAAAVSAGTTAAAGGNIEQIAKSAATAAVSVGVGGNVANAVGTELAKSGVPIEVAKAVASSVGSASAAAATGGDVANAAASGLLGSVAKQTYQAITTQEPAPIETVAPSGIPTGAAAQPTIEQLYQQVLGRAPDPGGLAYWSQYQGDPTAAFVAAAQAERPGATYTPLEQQIAQTAEQIRTTPQAPGIEVAAGPSTTATDALPPGTTQVPLSRLGATQISPSDTEAKAIFGEGAGTEATGVTEATRLPFFEPGELGIFGTVPTGGGARGTTVGGGAEGRPISGGFDTGQITPGITSADTTDTGVPSAGITGLPLGGADVTGIGLTPGTGGPGPGGPGGAGPGGEGEGEGGIGFETLLPTETTDTTTTDETKYPIDRIPLDTRRLASTRLFTPYRTDLTGLAPIERRKKTELTEEEGEPVGRWGSETLRGLLGI